MGDGVGMMRALSFLLFVFTKIKTSEKDKIITEKWTNLVHLETFRA
jgi:hypothetical protein